MITIGNYSIIKREFSFLETKYGFKKILKQRYGSYCFILWTNGIKKIMVLFDDRIDKKRESPLKIRIYDADCFGTYYDDVEEYTDEFRLEFVKPKERIRFAAKWFIKAIENKRILDRTGDRTGDGSLS